jgi:hypothetical protein
VRADPWDARRAAREEIRKILFAPPRTAWAVDEDKLDGVHFKLSSVFDLGATDGVFSGVLRRKGTDTEKQLERRSKVWAAGGYVRTDAIVDGEAPMTCGIEHPKLGAVYIELADRSYLHFSPEQLSGQNFLTEAAKEIHVEWALEVGKEALLLSARGAVSLDLEIKTAGEASAYISHALLAACLPGVAQLTELGLPLADLAKHGAPHAVTVWQVDRNGKRMTPLAVHEIVDIEVGPIAAETFRIPEGFRDLRQQPTEDRRWQPVYRGKLRPKRTRSSARGKAKQATKSATVQGQGTMMQFVPGLLAEPPKIAAEPTLPACLPSTLQTSCGYEIRQSLLDSIRYFLNLIGERLTMFAGARVTGGTDVSMTIDWLNQLQAFSDGSALGDGLFCLLRERPPIDDPTAGGGGLLDKLAASLAAELLASAEPLPVGGADPITLPQSVVDQIATVIADGEIAPEDRFAALSAENQAALREAVLAQRYATIDYPFHGDFGEHSWPSGDFDLIHAKLQLERLAITLGGGELVPRLVITVDDDGRPRIEFTLSLATIDATVHMERWPGLWFWIVVPGVLVAAGIATAAGVAALTTTLIGLGPLGLLLLSTMLSAAPLATLAAVASGLLLLAAVTYLVWDVTNIHLTISNAVLGSSVAPEPASNPEEVVLDPDRATLDGTIIASVHSEIPSGLHQIFDWLVNILIPLFDAQIRELLEDKLVDGLEDAARRLPHLRLPLPQRIRLNVPVTGGMVPSFPFDSPRHRLTGFAANGVKDTLLNASSLTIMEFPFPMLRPYLTQVDQDSREKLTRLIQELLDASEKPMLGYAISQNLLNGIVFSRWLLGRHAADYDEAQTTDAFEALIAACPECAAVADRREVHVWAAAPPSVLVTPRAFIEDPRQPYLLVVFPDVRLCLSGSAGKASTLEIQFSVTSIAHVAFGRRDENGNRWTLFSVQARFLHVRFDERHGLRKLSPIEIQGMETSGPGFARIAEMTAAERLAFLQLIQPVLDCAARRLLHRENATGIIFDGDLLSRQVYDQMIAVDFVPRRASVYATCAVFGPANFVMPSRDESGAVVGLFDNMTCADGRALLPFLSGP